ncbi:helix-turn-helix domain-containing protein [Rhodococcus hoagii]|nr:helix-turn-helix domain-containing protein [Prescottella equi]NKT91782.1 helix-turn-helix domain-containing protein [Prescottella equi]
MDADRRLPEAQVVRDAIANEIRALRGRRRMTQADLIRESGLSRATIGRIENGERDMDIQQGIAIATALGVTVAELLQAVQDSLEGKQL